MVSTLYFKKLDDGKMTQMLRHAPFQPTPSFKKSSKILLILIQNQATGKNGFYALFKKIG